MIRPRQTRRRHLAGPNLAHDSFPPFRLSAHPRQIQLVQRDAVRIGLSVTAYTVLIDQPIDLGGRWRAGACNLPASALTIHGQQDRQGCHATDP